jgi:pimeloyl-ACP methyl ester carboxylesterase
MPVIRRAPVDLPLNSRYLLPANGLRRSSSDSDKGGAVPVWVAGLMGDPGSFSRFQRRLPPGFGLRLPFNASKSAWDIRAERRFPVEEWDGDLAVKEVVQDLPDAKVVVVAHSAGATVGLDLVSELSEQDRLKGAVLVEPPLSTHTASKFSFIEAIKELLISDGAPQTKDELGRALIDKGFDEKVVKMVVGSASVNKEGRIEFPFDIEFLIRNKDRILSERHSPEQLKSVLDTGNVSVLYGDEGYVKSCTGPGEDVFSFNREVRRLPGSHFLHFQPGNFNEILKVLGKYFY